MAMFGYINITGSSNAIAYWEAQRLDDLIDKDQVSTYKCLVNIADLPEVFEFEVEHKYSDGAVVLLQKVLAKYQEETSD